MANRDSLINPRDHGGVRVRANGSGSYDVIDAAGRVVKTGLTGPGAIQSGFGSPDWATPEKLARLVAEAFQAANKHGDGITRDKIAAWVDQAFAKGNDFAGSQIGVVGGDTGTQLPPQGSGNDFLSGESGQVVGGNFVLSPEGRALFEQLVAMFIALGYPEDAARAASFEMCGGSMPLRDSPSPLTEANPAKPPADGIAPVTPGVAGQPISPSLSGETGVGARGGDRDAGSAPKSGAGYEKSLIR